MTLDSYGGNPDVVATREEIERVAFEIKLCAEALAAWSPLDQLLSDPLKQIQYRLMSISIYQKLEQLYRHCLLASDSYFTGEAQIHRRFEFTLIPQLAQLTTSFGTTLGWRLDRDVKVEITSETGVNKPASITTLLERLWDISNDKTPTLRIDLLENPDQTKTALVYVPGTQSFSFGDEDNPLDMASNLQAMAGGGQAASEKAVIEAIRQAGINTHDQVILIGHSQGGMVAGNIANSANGFLVAGLVTFGAPIAQLKNLKAPVMAIEHVNDPVPNISGKANPNKSNWVTVQRVSEKSEANALLFSHSLKAYKNTTLAVDVSDEVGIKNIRSQLLEKIESTKPLKSLEFRISRESR